MKDAEQRDKGRTLKCNTCQHDQQIQHILTVYLALNITPPLILHREFIRSRHRYNLSF